MSLYYDTDKPHPCERLALLEGCSNFLGLLRFAPSKDDDDGDGPPDRRFLRSEPPAPDTVPDAHALGLIRDRCTPEALEVYWGGSRLHRYMLGQLVFETIAQRGKIRDRDRIWTKGAILDALDLFGAGACAVGRERAKRFGVRYEDYLAARKLAGGILTALEGDARRNWLYVRFR